MYTNEQIKELAALKSAQGILHPEEVVKRASKSNSSLHCLFTWSNAEAAHEYRLDEARRVIREVRVRLIQQERRVHQVTVKSTTINVPAYVSPIGLRDNGGGFRKVEDLSPEDILETARRELGGCTKRILELAAAADFNKRRLEQVLMAFEAVDKLLR